MSDDPDRAKRIRLASADAVIKALNEGRSIDEIADAGEHAADDQYWLERQQLEMMAGRRRPGPDIGNRRFWKVALIAIGCLLVLYALIWIGMTT